MKEKSVKNGSSNNVNEDINIQDDSVKYGVVSEGKDDVTSESKGGNGDEITTKKKHPNLMNVRDLIFVGLFTILMAVVTMLISFIGFLPQLMPAIPIAVGLICGPIYMLFATKITKPGMFFISWFLCGAFFGALGHGVWTIGSYAVGGIIGELILLIKKYKSINGAKFAFSIASLSIIGQMLPMFINRDEFIQKIIKQGYTADYANKVIELLPSWSIAPILIAGVVATFIGCTLGVLMLKKHFVKAGMVKKIK